MGRQRTVSDEAVLAAAAKVMGRTGPERLTLADIAAECGLAPATLVQRYGSKRGLQLALARMGAESAPRCFDQARAGHDSPLAALFAAFEGFACLAPTPEALANSLGFLQMDIADPEFRHWTRLHSTATLAGYRTLLEEAVAAGELRDCDPKAMARLIQAASHGSLVAWAVHQQGTARDWLRRDMENLLAPYLVSAGPRTRRKRTAPAGSASKRPRRRR